MCLSKVSTRDDGGRLVVDSNLEASGTPVHKLDGPLGLDGGDGSVDILGDHVTPVQKAAGHVLAVAGVALHHLVGGLKASVGDFSYGHLLVVSLLGGDDGGVGNQGEVDPGVGHQIGLELSEIHVEGSIKSQRGGDGGDNLANKTIQIGVRGPLDVEVPSADVINGLVVNHEGAVRVLQGCVGGQDRIVGLDHGSGHLRSRVDCELQLGLLAVVHRETLHQQGGKSRAGASSEGMEEKESLETSALVSKLTNTVQDKIDNLLSDGVVASGVIVGGVLLAVDELLRMIELFVSSHSGFIDDSRLKINKDSPGHVLAGPSLGKEGLEGVIAEGLVAGHAAIRLDAVLEAVELPAGVTDLTTSLADVDGDTLTHAD